MADVVAGNWTVFDALCAQVAAAGKKLLVRVGGQGNSVHNGGTIPDAWYTAIGASPTTLDIYPGKTYTFNQPGTPIIVRCIPVFYNPDYVALRLTAIATFWAHIATLSAQIRAAITHSNVQLCESQHDDWSIATRTVIDNVGGPNGTGYDRSEYHRWIDSVMAGGAGYTSAAMLDQAKQNMIAMVNGADAAGLSATVKFFAPFGTIGPSNTTALDLAAATTEGYPYPQLYMIHKITDWANATYPGRFLLARESLAACNMVDANLAAVGGAPWYWLQNATAVGGANAAQMLWNTHNDSTFRNNGGNNINCKRGSDPRYPNLVSTEQDIMDQCFDHGGHTQVGFQCEIVEPYLVDCTGAIDLTWGASQIDP
jgi:hypothetical protein